ncbi:MAG: ATP phosphoribosyltransferase [Aquificaceae bacterium]|nr:ATP phosphoribosyltransferase [Aquificaceae bacterium]MDW8237095.1 ATP phosphoribosyltransferase [Aquificaceae bacterium]
MLKLALPKGRLLDDSLKLLASLGFLDKNFSSDRKLLQRLNNFEVLLVKPFDVPKYVEKGAAQLGIAGLDTIIESKADVYHLLKLPFGICTLCVAGKPESQSFYERASHLRVASKYPNITFEFFSKRARSCEIIHLSGSVELAPIVGLSDIILDLVQTGQTLRENGLVVFEKVLESSAVFICNRSGYRLYREEILKLISSLEGIY